MKSSQLRDCQNETKRIQARLRAGHAEADDMIVLARLLEELFAHEAALQECRESKQRVRQWKSQKSQRIHL